MEVEVKATPMNRNVVITTENGRGSGVIIATNTILTVFHNTENDSKIFVNKVEAVIVKVMPEYDLMLLGVKTPKMADIVLAETTSQDEEVIIWSNPLSHTGMVLHGRIIDIDNHKLFTDAHVTCGSSGAGVWNTNNELVGIVVAIEGKDKTGYPYGVIISAGTIQKFLEGK